jgi:hypothetical protein
LFSAHIGNIPVITQQIAEANAAKKKVTPKRVSGKDDLSPSMFPFHATCSRLIYLAELEDKNQGLDEEQKMKRQRRYYPLIPIVLPHFIHLILT